MPALKQLCPACNIEFESAGDGKGEQICPVCDTRFSAARFAGTARVARPDPAAAELHRRRQARRGAMTLFVVALGGGLLAAVWFYHDARRPAEARPAQQAVATVAPPWPQPAPQSNDNVPEPTEIPAAQVEIPKPAIPTSKPFPTQPQSVSDTLALRVNRAIDRGVLFLRKDLSQVREECRYLGLMGLALLECGAATNDPAIVYIAARLRAQQAELFQTYELSLAIMFFDRLGKASDRPLIEALGTRLCQGQQEDGTWTYHSQPRPKARVNRPVRSVAAPQPAPRPRGIGDHSNTQFGVLGAWVAGRHGVSVHEALERTDNYFQQIQNFDGSWGYRSKSGQHRDSMTCAGLMSLALGYGSFKRTGLLDSIWIGRSKSVDRGFGLLAQSLKNLDQKGGARAHRIVGADAGGDIYFLWSLERLAMAHDLKVIAGKPWYPWAASLLVESQQQDGSWRDSYGGAVDTCFALLILKRSNVAPDLTNMVGKAKNYPGLPLAVGMLEKNPQLEQQPLMRRPPPDRGALGPGLLPKEAPPKLLGPPLRRPDPPEEKREREQ